jgi:hypothetical protein
MILFPRFFYDDAAGEGGGGTTTDTNPAPLLTLDELKGYGFDSPDQLKTFLAKQKEDNIDPQEKLKQANLQKANLQKFAADNNIMAVDEFQARETLNSRPDVDLVKDSFIKEYKADNPDSSVEDATAAFETQYPLQSENPALKKWAEKQISKEAKEIRTPFESKYATAESRFKEDETLRTKIPTFNKVIDGIIEANTPDKITLYKAKEGDTEIPIEIELSADQKKELREQLGVMFKNPKTFLAYTKDETKAAEINAKIAKKIDGFIKINNFDKAVEQGFEKGKGIGVTKGSTVGAEQPFAIVRNINMPTSEQRVSADQEITDNDIAIRKALKR